MDIQITTTLSNKDMADLIANRLVGEKLAACVQVVGPITSTYRWEEKVEQSEEWLCIIKTRDALYPRVEDFIKALHPYDVPEIVATKIERGSREYLHWLETSTRR